MRGRKPACAVSRPWCVLIAHGQVRRVSSAFFREDGRGVVHSSLQAWSVRQWRRGGGLVLLARTGSTQAVVGRAAEATRNGRPPAAYVTCPVLHTSSQAPQPLVRNHPDRLRPTQG